jgi:hypothetical protein
MIDLDQIPNPTGVRDNETHQRPRRRRLAFALRILERVIDRNVMRPEESVDLIARLQCDQAAKIGLGEITPPVFLRSDGLQSRARQVTAVGIETLGNIIGNFDAQLHATPR